AWWSIDQLSSERDGAALDGGPLGAAFDVASWRAGRTEQANRIGHKALGFALAQTRAVAALDQADTTRQGNGFDGHAGDVVGQHESEAVDLLTSDMTSGGGRASDQGAVVDVFPLAQ